MDPKWTNLIWLEKLKSIEIGFLCFTDFKYCIRFLSRTKFKSLRSYQLRILNVTVKIEVVSKTWYYFWNQRPSKPFFDYVVQFLSRSDFSHFGFEIWNFRSKSVPVQMFDAKFEINDQRNSSFDNFHSKISPKKNLYLSLENALLLPRQSDFEFRKKHGGSYLFTPCIREHIALSQNKG